MRENIQDKLKRLSEEKSSLNRKAQLRERVKQEILDLGTPKISGLIVVDGGTWSVFMRDPDFKKNFMKVITASKLSGMRFFNEYGPSFVSEEGISWFSDELRQNHFRLSFSILIPNVGSLGYICEKGKIIEYQPEEELAENPFFEALTPMEILEICNEIANGDQ